MLPLLLLLSIFVASLSAATFRLQVRDAGGMALAASGVLSSSASGSIQSFSTDAQGRASFDNLKPGKYRVALSSLNFSPQTIEIELNERTAVERVVTMSILPSSFRLEVIATSPIAGIDRPLNEIPSAVQIADSGEMESSGALNLADFVNRRMSGAYLNEMQGNPFQVDLNYRGYTASPLLGTPQGISLYLDGVRINQPFGDVVSWDLIPRNMISELTLEPGSNPLFGLNTLGGAVVIEMKDGRRFPGTSVQVRGGSFGRKMADIEHGGFRNRGDWLISTSLFFEDGWRESSPSNVRQFFGRFGWQGVKSSLNLTTSFANNSLIGNGLQDQQLLREHYSSIYTKPDITNQRSPFVTLRGRRAIGSRWSLAGNVYYRSISAHTLNGDINEESLDQSLYTLSNSDIAALRAAGYSGFPLSGANASNTPFPFWRCIAQVLQQDEPSEKCNGLLNRSNTRQHNYGLTGQLSWAGVLGRLRHQITAGGAWDGNRVSYGQSTELGYLNPDRSITGTGAYGDGETGGEVDGEPYDTRVNLKSNVRTGSVYATDTLSYGQKWHLTLSGRMNRTVIHNRDLILPGGGPGSLDGRHTFQRFNPAVGFTTRVAPGVHLVAGYTEGNRAPTAIELGCADPESPCRLPNAMAGDPPLKQVVTRSIEAGLRGQVESKWHWNLSYFQSRNSNDILFVASQQTGFGYFKNFGSTRRQGLEAGVSGSLSRFTAGSSYTLLDARFSSHEVVNGSGNSSNALALNGTPGLEGTIQIAEGSAMPLTPRHMGKSYLGIQATRRLNVNLDAIAISSAIARGNENNRHHADGVYYLGAGSSPGYLLTNGQATYQLSARLQLFVQVNNLFNRRYYSAAQLGATGFQSKGAFVARPFAQQNGNFPLRSSTFLAPGSPIGAWVGAKFRF